MYAPKGRVVRITKGKKEEEKAVNVVSDTEDEREKSTSPDI